MVRSGHVYRVEVFLLVEKFPPILIDLDAGEADLDSVETKPVHVGHRDKLHVRACRQRLNIGLGHPGGAEACVVQCFTRRRRVCAFITNGKAIPAPAARLSADRRVRGSSLDGMVRFLCDEESIRSVGQSLAESGVTASTV